MQTQAVPILQENLSEQSKFYLLADHLVHVSGMIQFTEMLSRVANWMAMATGPLLKPGCEVIRLRKDAVFADLQHLLKDLFLRQRSVVYLSPARITSRLSKLKQERSDCLIMSCRVLRKLDVFRAIHDSCFPSKIQAVYHKHHLSVTAT